MRDKLTHAIRRLPRPEVWTAMISVALTIALLLTFLPYEVSVDTGGLLGISLRPRQAGAQGSIGLDNTSVATLVGREANITWQHTCGANTTILVVMVQVNDSSLSDRTVSSVTYNGDALLHANCDADEDSYLRTEIWYRVNPDIGADQDIVVTMGGTCTDLLASAISLSGVDTDTPINDADATVGDSADAQTTSSPTVDYAWIVATLGDDYSVASGTLIGLDNEIHQTDIGSDVLAAGYKSDTGGAGNYNVGWHFYLANDFVISAVALTPVAGGPCEPEITNTPDNYGFGFLQIGTSSNTSIDYFTITNVGDCAVDITVQGTNLTAGDDIWELSADASVGENIYGLHAGLDDADDLFDVVVNLTANSFVTNLASSATQDWGLNLSMPDSLSGFDGNNMTGTITLVASEA